MPTTLKKPLIRRIGRLVIRIRDEGLDVRGFRKHKWRHVSWDRVASLIDEHGDIILKAEQAAGSKALRRIDARPDEVVG